MGQHGLPRARLAGEDVQARSQPQLRPLDEQEVLDAQLKKHVPWGRTSRLRRRGRCSEVVARFARWQSGGAGTVSGPHAPYEGSRRRHRRPHPSPAAAHRAAARSASSAPAQTAAAEPLPEPVVEVRPRELGEVALVGHEVGRDLLPRRQLADRAAVDVHLDGLLVARRSARAARREGATTSARAVSECGAMKETTKPSTPHASTGPPLARL